jgi:predicted Zn-dependent protease
VLALCLSLAIAGPAAAQPGLTGAPQLARVYDAIFDARFEAVPALLEKTCPPAPEPACLLLDAVSVWWRIQLDPDDTAYDAQFLARVEAAIAAADAWTTREPQRAEAWFYLGGAYGARVQWRVLRGEQLAAARDGKRIKDALERAVMLDPGMQDAYFGIGLYHYYADVAPAAAKVLRWLLALPGGNRKLGLDEMLRARNGGQLLRGEADYQLHVLYLWYEKQPERGLDLLQALHERYPHNPHFLHAIAHVEDRYLYDATASLRSYQALLAAARAGRVVEPAMTSVAARLGIARQLDQLFETDLAIAQLRAVIEARPEAPINALTQAYRQLREAEARMKAPAYRLSLDGWRALERGDLDAADRALTQSLALKPKDPLTQYRYAKLLLARHQDDEALVVLAGIHKRHEETPPLIYTLACVDAARVHERQGSTQVAIDLYRAATTVFGGDRRAKEAARQQAMRLTIASR